MSPEMQCTCGRIHEMKLLLLAQTENLHRAVEEQLLAGCAFLAGANGERYYFLKDEGGANSSSCYLAFLENKWAFVIFRQNAPTPSGISIPMPIPCPF